jgi:hypothetical protein
MQDLTRPDSAVATESCGRHEGPFHLTVSFDLVWLAKVLRFVKSSYLSVFPWSRADEAEDSNVGCGLLDSS